MGLLRPDLGPVLPEEGGEGGGIALYVPERCYNSVFLTRSCGSRTGIGTVLRGGWARSGGGAHGHRPASSRALPRHRADPGRFEDLSDEKGSLLIVETRRIRWAYPFRLCWMSLRTLPPG